MKKSLLIILTGLISTVASAQTQPPNIGFEDWETLDGPISNQYEEPTNWSSSNECTALINQFAVEKSSDAHSGNFSIRMETFSALAGTVRANGIITTAQMICLANGGGQEGGIAYSEQFPDSLAGWYKYAPANQDSAYIQVMFLADNEQDTVCFTRKDLFAATEWTRFSVPLCENATSNSAELLSLFFSSSWGDGGQGEAEVGSVLFIDDIEFITTVGVDEAESERTWTVYPNPVVGELNVQVLRGQEATIEIIDVTGKLVKREKVNESNSKVDLNSLVTGIYLYQIRSTENQVLRTGKLLVNP